MSGIAPDFLESSSVAAGAEWVQATWVLTFFGPKVRTLDIRSYLAKLKCIFSKRYLKDWLT